MAAILKNGGHFEYFFWLKAFFERGAHGECSCQICCLYHHLKDCFTYLPHYFVHTRAYVHTDQIAGAYLIVGHGRLESALDFTAMTRFCAFWWSENRTKLESALYGTLQRMHAGLYIARFFG